MTGKSDELARFLPTLLDRDWRKSALSNPPEINRYGKNLVRFARLHVQIAL